MPTIQEYRDALAKACATLEAAEHWLAEEAASPHPGQTRPDEILRVIREALGKPHDAPDAAPAAPQTPAVDLVKMGLSDGRADFFLRIKAGDREVTPHVFREEYKAAYHVALYRWLLCGGDMPDLVAFGPDDWPAIPSVSPDASALMLAELLRNLRNMTNLYVQLQGHETAYSREARAAIAAAEGREG